MRHILLFFILLLPIASQGSQKLCPNIILEDGKLELGANEKILVCGSGQSDSWNQIPVPQAEYQINLILQNKGYLNARFERHQDHLSVWLGEVTRAHRLIVHDPTGLLDAGKKRKIIGNPIEPDRLDAVKQWAELGLRRRGYACPKVDVTAQTWKNTVTVDVYPGKFQTLRSVDRRGIGNLDPKTFNRFEAYSVGQPYNVIEAQISAARVMAQGLFQSAYYLTTCDGDQADLRLVADIGSPRLMRFGLGASSEELPFADLWFKNARLDDRASNFTAVLHASNIRQSLTLDSEFYIVPGSSRSFLGPRFLVEHRKERSYQINHAELGGDVGRDWDLFHTRLHARAGPTLNYDKTVRGLGPPDAKYLSWQASTNLMSHAYEAFSRDQFEGWIMAFKYRGQRKGVGSEINVDRYELSIKHLLNLGGFSPPLFVLATRAEGLAVNSSQITSVDKNQNLPVDYRVFYGGDDNLRGFSRESINNNELGYLTALHGGLELRLVQELPYRLEPFLLADFARLGERRLTLDRPIFTASGYGLRWPSPIGTLRFSAANGRIWGGNVTTEKYQQQWVYFLSFGQEF